MQETIAVLFIAVLVTFAAAVIVIYLHSMLGTLLSILLVMGILPQLLLLGDFIIDKTSFKKPEKKEKKANEEENEEKKENVPIGKEAVEGA